MARLVQRLLIELIEQFGLRFLFRLDNRGISTHDRGVKSGQDKKQHEHQIDTSLHYIPLVKNMPLLPFVGYRNYTLNFQANFFSILISDFFVFKILSFTMISIRLNWKMRD